MSYFRLTCWCYCARLSSLLHVSPRRRGGALCCGCCFVGGACGSGVSLPPTSLLYLDTYSSSSQPLHHHYKNNYPPSPHPSTSSHCRVAVSTHGPLPIPKAVTRGGGGKTDQQQCLKIPTSSIVILPPPRPHPRAHASFQIPWKSPPDSPSTGTPGASLCAHRDGWVVGIEGFCGVTFDLAWWSDYAPVVCDFGIGFKHLREL